MEDKLLASGRNAMKNAYAPYSKYRVGAAVVDEDGNIFAGCNIENSSYGATMCAERTAIFNCISKGSRKIKAIAITAEGSMPYPCGMCRQVMSQFMDMDSDVFVASSDKVERYTLGQLLPKAFELDFK